MVYLRQTRTSRRPAPRAGGVNSTRTDSPVFRPEPPGETFEVPRLGDRVVEVTASTNLLDLFRQALTLPQSTGLDYQLRGRLLLADSLGWLRFTREGSLLPEGTLGPSPTPR